MFTEDEEWFMKIAKVNRSKMVIVKLIDFLDAEREKADTAEWLAILDMLKADVQEKRDILEGN